MGRAGSGRAGERPGLIRCALLPPIMLGPEVMHVAGDCSGVEGRLAVAGTKPAGAIRSTRAGVRCRREHPDRVAIRMLTGIIARRACPGVRSRARRRRSADDGGESVGFAARVVVDGCGEQSGGCAGRRRWRAGSAGCDLSAGLRYRQPLSTSHAATLAIWSKTWSGVQSSRLRVRCGQQHSAYVSSVSATGRRHRPVIQATRTAEMLGQQFHLSVRREPGRRPLRAGPELRGRVG
jgi:hypothetical protein